MDGIVPIERAKCCSERLSRHQANQAPRGAVGLCSIRITERPAMNKDGFFSSRWKSMQGRKRETIFFLKVPRRQRISRGSGASKQNRRVAFYGIQRCPGS